MDVIEKWKKDNRKDLEQRAAQEVKALTKKAKSGDAEAMYKLGFKFYRGEYIKKDYKKAVFWFAKAVEKKHANACIQLGYCYYNGYGVKKDANLSRAYYDLERCYRKGNEPSDEILSIIGGKQTKPDKKMLKELTAKAKRGDAKAQYGLAKKYHQGIGVEKDEKKALYWYEKYAEAGGANAQYNLGSHYFTAKEYSKSFYWYQKAADNGDAAAQRKIGKCYECGWGVKADLDKAVLWYEKAGEKGNLDAQIDVAEVYYREKKDAKKAIYWFEKAAEQNYVKAQLILARALFG